MSKKSVLNAPILEKCCIFADYYYFFIKIITKNRNYVNE